MANTLFENFSDTTGDVRHYVRTYVEYLGGIRNIVSSVYFVVAFILTLLGVKVWYSDEWWSLPISILPSILGFSIAGYTILLSIGNRRFQQALVETEVDGMLVYDEMHADFVHFVLVQVAAILIAILARSLYYPPPHFLRDFQVLVSTLNVLFTILSGLGYLTFVYSLTLAVPCILSIFSTAGILKEAMKLEIELEKKAAQFENSGKTP